MMRPDNGPAGSGRYLVRSPRAFAVLTILDAISLLFRTPASPPPQNPRSILVSNWAHLGDVITATAVLPALRRRWPDARIGFLTSSGSRRILEGHPLVDRVHLSDHPMLDRRNGSIGRKWVNWLRSLPGLVRELRRERYDLAIDLYFYFPNGIPLLRMARIPVRLGWRTGGFGPLLTRGLGFGGRRMHVIDRHAELLKEAGLEDPDLAAMRTVVARPPFAGAPLPAGTYVVLHPGTALEQKEWPAESWRRLARDLAAAGIVTVLTGTGPQETALTAAMAEGLDGCHDFAGRLDWPALLAVIAGAQHLVGVDSMAVHLARALDVPATVIYAGVNDPAMWAPPGARVLMTPIPCAPCLVSSGCPGMECIRGIDPATVVRAVLTERSGN